MRKNLEHTSTYRVTQYMEGVLHVLETYNLPLTRGWAPHEHTSTYRVTQCAEGVLHVSETC